MGVKFNLQFAQVDFSVQRDYNADGFRMKLLVRPAMEEMFDTFLHTALFKYENDAKAYLANIKIKRELDMDYWFGPDSKASPYQFDNSGKVLSNVPVVSKRLQDIQNRPDYD